MSAVGSSPALQSSSSDVISVVPTNLWDGNDGPWSTFTIHVGTPPQALRVLVSTAVGETWAVLDNKTQGGCLTKDPSNCADMRGGLFNVNASSTWTDKGIYALGVELNLPDYDGVYDNGDYGFDALGLGPIDSPSVNFKSQTISGIATKDFFLGSLGVNSHNTNFSSFKDSQIPLLTSLKESNTTKSLSFGYTAGARYRQNSTGSLTLGGYDASKFVQSNTTFRMAPDIDRDLVVALTSVTYQDKENTQPLLVSGIDTYIDSTVPEIWLPRDCCLLFEKSFGLAYNSSLNRYLVNDTLHSSLLAKNPSVAFVLQASDSALEEITITLPYGSFDLELSYPHVNGTQKYFPLRRADNDTQYTLGRTFLQEAYLIVDYERQNFSVWQNSWNFQAGPQLVSIPAANQTGANGQSDQTTAGKQTKHHVSAGTIAGATVGAILAVAGIISFLFYVWRWKRRKRLQEEPVSEERKASSEFSGKPELDGSGKFQGELDSTTPLPPEAEGQARFEMQGTKLDLSKSLPDPPSEVEGSRGGAELLGTTGGVEVGGGSEAAELEDHCNRWSIVNSRKSGHESDT